MRLVSLLFIFILAVACGQESGSKKSGGSQAENGCNLNGRQVACESILGADGEGVDLLDSVIDVPIKIEDATITFLSDKSAMSQGRRINCRVGVKSGETYRYALRGDSLLIMSSEGSFEMTRLNSSTGIVGTWIWKGYVDNGTHMIRQLSFLSNSRVIMKNNCEL